MRNPLYRLGTGLAPHRCPQCRLARPACLCALIPRLETRTRVVLVLHQLEDRKTSNTGRLAVRCLPNSEVVIRGDRSRGQAPPREREPGSDRPDGRDPEGSPPRGEGAGGAPSAAAREPPVVWSALGDPVLLFPHADARPIEAWRGNPRPVTLIVPDGTWGQGQRVRHRIAGLADIPCATVSRDGPSRYRLRTTADPRRLSTLEAIAEALGVLEGAGPREALLRIFDVMVERSLEARAGGWVPAPDSPIG
jgi:DTW domain-containing protein YfiP